MKLKFWYIYLIFDKLKICKIDMMYILGCLQYYAIVFDNCYYFMSNYLNKWSNMN